MKWLVLLGALAVIALIFWRIVKWVGRYDDGHGKGGDINSGGLPPPTIGY